MTSAIGKPGRKTWWRSLRIRSAVVLVKVIMVGWGCDSRIKPRPLTSRHNHILKSCDDIILVYLYCYNTVVYSPSSFLMKTIKQLSSETKKYRYSLSFPLFVLGITLIVIGRIEGLILWFLVLFTLQRPKEIIFLAAISSAGLAFGLAALQMGNDPTANILFGIGLGAIFGLVVNKVLRTFAPKTFA